MTNWIHVFFLLQGILDEATMAWGIKVERVEMWVSIYLSVKQLASKPCSWSSRSSSSWSSRSSPSWSSWWSQPPSAKTLDCRSSCREPWRQRQRRRERLGLRWSRSQDWDECDEDEDYDDQGHDGDINDGDYDDDTITGDSSWRRAKGEQSIKVRLSIFYFCLRGYDLVSFDAIESSMWCTQYISWCIILWFNFFIAQLHWMGENILEIYPKQIM